MRFPRALCLTLAVLASSLASAGNDTVYYPDQGKVVIPNLKMGNRYYYVILNQIPKTYDFRLSTPSITDLSVPLTFTPAGAADLIGTFSPADEPNSSITLTANGTYSMVAAAQGEPDCPNGGPESGTYQYDPTTGVLTAVATSDSNGTCGLSHSDGIGRVKKSGSDLYLLIKEDGMNVEMKLIRK